MVKIQPFTGLRYNPQQVSKMDDVVAPPYDVISPSEQSALYDKSPYNIVRLILGKKAESDSDTDNVYSRAHQVLESWREAGVMQEEGAPAIYAYTQAWAGIDKEILERRGFIARLQLEPYETGQILPHEYTLGGPKADRLALFKATGTILSPIFCLYNDPQKQVEADLFTQPPTGITPVEVYDHDGVFHRFWPVTDAAVVSNIQQVLADKKALIADGHHRFETAVAYQAWRSPSETRLAPEGSLPWDYTMAFFTNMADEGLKIYPTHRVFTSLPGQRTSQQLLSEMAPYFEAVSDDKALVWVEGGKGTIAKQGYALKSDVDLSALPQVVRDLDVAVLDQLVFKGILGQEANQLKQQGDLHFIRDEAEIQTLLSEPSTLVFWVHAPSVEAVRIICESGLRMPQKSTYFYPKLLSGLVLYYYGLENNVSPKAVPVEMSAQV